jgi:beta-1,4-glucosyltransferase
MHLGEVVSIAGFPVLAATQQAVACHLMAVLHDRSKATILFANSNFIIKCKRLLHRMHDDSVILVNDGIGMDIAAHMLHGRSFGANLNGTDFTPYLFHHADRPLRVFLLGGKPEVTQKAAAYVAQSLGQLVVGACDGYTGMADSTKVIEIINQSGAEVLLVALGNPLQEEWILDHRAALTVPVVSGVGALFDFWAGDKPRAPRFVRKIRMEWFYRLCLEPRRLMRRYTLDMMLFFVSCLTYRRAEAAGKLKHMGKASS